MSVEKPGFTPEESKVINPEVTKPSNNDTEQEPALKVGDLAQQVFTSGALGQKKEITKIIEGQNIHLFKRSPVQGGPSDGKVKGRHIHYKDSFVYLKGQEHLGVPKGNIVAASAEAPVLNERTTPITPNVEQGEVVDQEKEKNMESPEIVTTIEEQAEIIKPEPITVPELENNELERQVLDQSSVEQLQETEIPAPDLRDFVRSPHITDRTPEAEVLIPPVEPQPPVNPETERKPDRLDRFIAWAKDKGDELKQRAGDTLTNVRSSRVDSFRIGLRDRVVEYHDEKSIKISSERDNLAIQREELERERNAIDATIQDLSTKIGQPVSQRASDSAARDKFSLQRRIDKIKYQEDKLNTELDYRNGKKAEWQERRSMVVAEVADRYTDRIAPYEVSLAVAKENLDSLDRKIDEYSLKQQSHEQELVELRTILAKSAKGADRDILEGKISKLEQDKVSARQSIAQARSERATLSGRYSKVSRRMDRLNDKRNGYLRITQTLEPSSEPAARAQVQSNISNLYSFRNSSEDESDNGIERFRDRANELELVKKLPSDFAEEYNKMFPKGEQIDKKAFDEYLKKKTYIRTDKPFLRGEFVIIAQKYFDDVVRQRKAKRDKTPLKSKPVNDLRVFQKAA